MTKPRIDAHGVHRMILSAARCQVATTREARRIIEAGLGEEMQRLIEQISANAANPIAYALADDDAGDD